MIDANTALSLGIVNHVVPGAQLEAEVKSLAQKIALGPGVAIRAVKKTLFGSEKKELSEALEREVQEQIGCYLSEDCSEGIARFSTSGLRNFRASSLPGSSPDDHDRRPRTKRLDSNSAQRIGKENRWTNWKLRLRM